MEDLITNNVFYVYALLDPRNDEVFYIGRGKERRAWAHLRPSLLKENSPKNKIINDIINSNNEVEIIIIEDNLSFENSLNIEKELIKLIGKENLTNRTTGGQGLGSGVKGFLGKTHTIESRNKISKSRLGNKNPMAGNRWHRSPEGIESFIKKSSGKNHPLFGKSHSEETKEKIRKSLKGTKLSDEQKIQRSQSMKEVWNKRRLGLIPDRKSNGSLKRYTKVNDVQNKL